MDKIAKACCLLSQLIGASAFRSSKFGNIMDAGDLGINLTISDEDISDEIREIQEASSDDDLQLHDRGIYLE